MAWGGVGRSRSDVRSSETRRPLRCGSGVNGPGQKHAARRGAHLAFPDESGFLLIPNVRKTWAPVGHTPQLRHSYRHDRVSVISALTVAPQRRRFGLTGTRRTSTSPTSTWCCPTTPPVSTTARTKSPRKRRPHGRPPSAGMTSTQSSGSPKFERSEQRQRIERPRLVPGSSAPLSTTRLNGRAHRTASSALDFVHRA